MKKMMHKGSPMHGSGTSKKPDAELRQPKKMSVDKSPSPKMNVHMVKRFKGQGGKR